MNNYGIIMYNSYLYVPPRGRCCRPPKYEAFLPCPPCIQASLSALRQILPTPDGCCQNKTTRNKSPPAKLISRLCVELLLDRHILLAGPRASRSRRQNTKAAVPCTFLPSTTSNESSPRGRPKRGYARPHTYSYYGGVFVGSGSSCRPHQLI